MKKIAAFCLLLAGLLTFAPAPLVAAPKEGPLKIGIIDTQKLIREAKAAKSARAAFQKELDAKRAILEAKGKEVRTIEEQLKKAPSAKLREDLAKEAKEFSRLKSDLEEELKKKDVALAQKIMGELRQIVLSFSKSEGYALILEKSAVVASSEAIDITDKILKIYDEKK